MNIVLQYILILQCLNIIQHGHTKMPIYCMEKLNTSDCKQTPKNVFSYYKPGSRCEIEVWRGCPSSNKFDTEEECSETCIYRNVDLQIKTKDKLNDKCLSTPELTDCDEKMHNVFKYDPLLRDCVEISTSCKSPNVFEEKLDCIEKCVRELSWEEKLKLTSERQIKELDSILENLFNQTNIDGDGSQSVESTDTGNSSHTGTPSLANSTNDNDNTQATNPGEKLKGDGKTDNTIGLNNTITTVEGNGKITDGQNTNVIENSTDKTTRVSGTVPFVEIK